MENAIQMMQSSGQAEPRAMASMYASAAHLHMQSGNLDKAMERVKQSLKLCREHSLKDAPAFALMVAAQIIGKSDDEAASKFLEEQLNAPDASPKYKSEVLKALGQHLQQSGNLVDGLRAKQKHLVMIRKEAPGSLEEARALLDLMSSFYKAMLAGADKAGALRTAMLETRKKFHDANAWAPFTIYGYPR